jgi:hypothetical protein
LKVGTSFNIVAGGATELSVCDYSAEVEMRRPEAKGNRLMKLSDRMFELTMMVLWAIVLLGVLAILAGADLESLNTSGG